jgi:hypothetical protein
MPFACCAAIKVSRLDLFVGATLLMTLTRGRCRAPTRGKYAHVVDYRLTFDCGFQFKAAMYSDLIPVTRGSPLRAASSPPPAPAPANIAIRAIRSEADR